MDLERNNHIPTFRKNNAVFQPKASPRPHSQPYCIINGNQEKGRGANANQMLADDTHTIEKCYLIAFP